MNREARKKIAGKYGQTVQIDDPMVPLDAWYPVFSQLHRTVIAEAGDFDYAKCRPDLYRQIRDAENAIDRMDEVRLSEVVAAMAVWRGLILKAVLEQGHKKVAG